MTAANFNFEVNSEGTPYIEQGASFRVPLIWKDSDGLPNDLTDYTARMQVRAAKEATDILLELTSENGRLVLGGLDGTITITLTATETAAIDWCKGVYDLEVVAPDGFVTRLLEGRVSVSKEVTR